MYRFSQQNPSSHTGTPRPLLQPGSALTVDHPRLVPMTRPPSHAATPLRPNTFCYRQRMSSSSDESDESITLTGGVLLQALNYSLAPAKKMVPNWDILMNISQSSDASQIHGLMLRYSDSDEVADKEMRQLNLQDAAHTYMMEHDAQDSITPVPFQDPKSPSQLIETEDRYIPDGQNTRLSQVAQKQLVHLPDGSLVSDCRSHICNSSLVQTGSLYTKTPSRYLLFMMQYFLRLPVVLNHNRLI